MSGVDKLKTTVGALLSEELPTRERIRELVRQLRRTFRDVTDEQAEEVSREFETIHDVRMTDGATLQETGFEPWLEAARSELEPYYWDRYRKLLAGRHFSAQVLATMDSVTERILGLLENPAKTGAWDRRGMVMGHVQSGKTANYTGVICKAADAGYRVVIVIAGIHNNLRNQTQRRIDEGFIGFDSTRSIDTLPRQIWLGVGLIDGRRSPSAFTTSQRDFNRASTSVGVRLQNLKEPAVFVIKKNSSTLRHLIDWLKAHNARHGTAKVPDPLLLIDDEADNASINVGREGEVSRINGQIRDLLDLFDRSCYVGYTATPFANIFIEPETEDEMRGDDLFPRDFIVSLDPPDNYVGASSVFVEDVERGDAERVVRSIEDHADILPLKHDKNHRVGELPGSLETAVRTFVVARAIRLVRGHERQHNSMLVNVSRFVAVQKQVRNEIHSLVDQVRGSVRVNGAKPPAEALADPEIAALCRAFNEYYVGRCPESWEDIQARLHESVSSIKVIEVNSQSSDPLDYEAFANIGLSVIAVGGYALSRGLTLEGLSISYFLRNSMMYDTLMQMGRWFGYRSGYQDLCRVWMPEEAVGWYTHIAESIDELRDELARMQRMNATPKEFGLRVRSHPDALIVTARNKMGSGRRITSRIGLANNFVETAILWTDRRRQDANRGAAISLAENLRKGGLAFESEDVESGGRLVRSAPVTHVLTFLGTFDNHQGSLQTQTEPIRRYIRERQYDELKDWDVYFPGVRPDQADPHSLQDASLGFPLVCQRRDGVQRNDNTLMVSSKQRVSSRGVEKVGLSEEEVRRAEERFRDEQSGEGARKAPPDRIYRRERTKPLLVVHLLAIGKRGDDLSGQQPVVAWSISFPTTRREEKTVEYLVNTTWYRDNFADEDDEDVADAGD